MNVITGIAADKVTEGGNLRVVAGDAEDAATLRAAGIRRATTLYACADEGSPNVGVGLLALQLARNDIAVMARSADTELVAALRARRISKVDTGRGFRLDFFTVESLAARALVDEQQPVCERPDCSVVVVGASSFGRSVILELLDRATEARTRRLDWVVEDRAQAKAFLAGHGVKDGVQLLDRLTGRGEEDVLFICMDDSDEGLRVGLAEVRTGTADIVVCLRARSAIGKAIEPKAVFDDMGSRLSVFGILDAACEPVRI